jgi:hypothetical protein
METQFSIHAGVSKSPGSTVCESEGELKGIISIFLLFLNHESFV